MKKGTKHSEESLKKISEANIGKRRSEETRKKMSEAKKGEKHPLFGKHHSEEHCKKISESCKKSFKGRKRFFSEEHRKKLSEAKKGVKNPKFEKHPSKETLMKISGKNHHNWQGGISGWRTILMNSMLYKAWRNAVLERDKFTCQVCGERGGKLQTHHIEPVRDHKNDLLIFDINNGITLCKDCHIQTLWHEYEFVDQFNEILGLK